MTEPPRWFFVHLQKTAGTALFQRINEHFPREAVYPLVADQRTLAATTDVDLLEQSFREHRDALRIITGHFPLCTVERLGVPFTTFTVLREPVERTLSCLRHLQAVDPVFRGQPLEVIYDDPTQFTCVIQNHMVKMLSLSVEEMTDGFLTPAELTSEHLALAKVNLMERIDVWGVQERFEELCDQLTARFGWDLGRPRFANRSQPQPAPSGLAERIEHDNDLDVALYQFALEQVHGS